MNREGLANRVLWMVLRSRSFCASWRVMLGNVISFFQPLGRVTVVGKKCAANLDLTNGFRMAANAHPRALRAVVYIYVFWVAVSWAGLLAKVFAPQASLHAYGSPPSRFHMLPVNLAPVDV